MGNNKKSNENSGAESEEEKTSSTDSSQKLIEFKSLRASTKGSITRIKNLVTKKSAELSAEELECRLGILESYFKQLLGVQANIDKICPESDREANVTFMDEIEEAYVSTKSKIMSSLSKKRPSMADFSMSNTTVALTPQSRLRRQIKLPKFEGKYSEFPKFLSLYNKMVHQDETLDDCERFLILKDSLGEKPLAAISDFDETDENYPKALERLKQNYDKKSLMFDEHISALFELQKVTKGSSSHLRQVIDSVNAHLSAMLSLGDYKDVANAMIIFLVMEKLDLESQVKWEESVDYKKLSSWEECSLVLARRCQNLEARETKTVRNDKPNTLKEIQRDSKQRFSFLRKNNQTSLSIGKSLCEFCHKSGHSIVNCPDYEKLSQRERYIASRNLKLCILCLKKGHLQKACTAPKCIICNLPHHKMLHRFDSSGSPNQNNLPSQNSILAEGNELASNASSMQQATLHTTLANTLNLSEIFLETAIVLVKDICGQYQTARVILDSASQINLMSESMAHRLMLKKSSCVLDANGIADISTSISKKVQTTIKSRVNAFEAAVEFYLLPKITGSKPDQFIDISWWNIPNNIELADPRFNWPARVDILLGAELFLDLLAIGRITLNENLPRLQKTVFGWVISGAARNCVGKNRLQSLFIDIEPLDPTAQLNNLVEKFWQLEQISMKSTFWTAEEEECERIFKETVKRNSSGRFIVKIPFKGNVNDLGDSYSIAERRFLALERRLDRDPTTKEAYVKFMEEYLQLGHMAVVEDMEKIKYFSPHQHVMRPESTSTKLRVVFDCSCKTNSGVSLNDVMMTGPVVQDDLLSIVLRFRCFKYALTADVTKMYRQVLVTEADANYQAILWRPSNEHQLKAYRLLTITYGTTAAPYLATRCLKKLGDDNAERYPLGSKKILADFYMDDLISGADTEEEVFQIYEEVSTIMNSAHFSLCKWHSNNEKFLRQVPEADRNKPLRVNEHEIIKTLGILWEPGADAFRYVWPEFKSSKSITKRIVLAELSTLFDPLGLINPVIVKAKIFIQDLWILKIAWDESLPMNLHSHWAEYRNKLKLVEDIRVPRYILSPTSCARVEVHGFADASKRAYGCCIYIRSIDFENKVTIQLWSAKSRVAPAKTKPTAHLELLAAELLSKLLVRTQSNFTVPTDATYLWSDSETVLNWLSAHPSKWPTFVANRVSSIQEATKNPIWRHVPTKMNPADIISRGAYANELHESIWFTGPAFLMEYIDKWPQNKERGQPIGCNEEHQTEVAAVLVQTDEENSVVIWIENHSQYERLQRKVANLLRFFRSVREKSAVADISVSLNDKALIRIVYCLQQHYFAKEIRELRNKGRVPSTSKLRDLNVFVEASHGVNLLRVGGRLERAQLPYDAKHQILMPSSSNFVRCYLRYLHYKNLHAGAQALKAIFFQRFWMVNAMKVIRRVTSKCLQCFRCRPRLEQQIMGNLPTGRVVVAKPFSTTGVDFCGPILTSYKLKGVRLTKSYVAVFVCFTTKAVHLEVTADLTAKAFIAALKRFVARRGLCARLYCDNGTNFVGARRELKEFKDMFFEQQTQQKISQYCTANNIEFRHIPPRSPHFGGLWEAAVKSAKYHLNRTLGTSHLSFEELSTVTTEIEAIMNSRPLTAMSNDPNDEAVLTPAHFLIGGPLVGITEPTLENEKISHLSRWLHVTAIQQHFWKRWSNEYLHELQQRAKWTSRRRNIEVGDLVLIAEDNLPPKQWLIGRVTHTIPDASGCVRVVGVKTKNGEIQRAIHKLAPIPKAE